LVKGDDTKLPGQLDPGGIPFALVAPEPVDQDHRRSVATPVADRQHGIVAEEIVGNGHGEAPRDPSAVDQLDPLDGPIRPVVDVLVEQS
jgi:hypothetical protein